MYLLFVCVYKVITFIQIQVYSVYYKKLQKLVIQQKIIVKIFYYYRIALEVKIILI